MEQDHVLRIIDDGGPVYEIDHPESCEVIDIDGMYRQHLCKTAKLEAEWGLSSHMPWWTFPEGEYNLAYLASGHGECMTEDLIILVQDQDQARVLIASDPERPGDWGRTVDGQLHVLWMFLLDDDQSVSVS